LLRDNKSAQNVLKNPVVNDNSNAELHAHFVQERIECRELNVIGFAMDDMISDGVTKALSSQKHCVACAQLGMDARI
jgi:hypothetical protein